MSPSLFQSIVTWAMPQLTDRSKLPNIVDPVIRDTMDLKHLYQVAAVAVLCVQPEPSYRPLITDVLHSFIPLELLIIPPPTPQVTYYGKFYISQGVKDACTAVLYRANDKILLQDGIELG
ncbi:protein kinase superfamily protein [Artemisia annua]|uniref:Protein kinase superfamily protein n=1 Tax=Artemisia annua TaxID=35608 RepID=A0A2U1K9E9_ARTAN|nr:protein kinase superfamily protein [Artemisia annua]